MALQETYILENLLQFVQILRQTGLPISLEQVLDCSRALTLVNIGERDQVFYAMRGTLITRREHLALFETLFNRFWRLHADPGAARPQKAPRAPRHDARDKRPNIVQLMAARARQTDTEIDVADKSGTYSHAESLQRKRFSEMTPEELETVKRLIQQMRWDVSYRRTRRREAARSGNLLHLRQALRTAGKYDGLPLELSWQRRRVKQRPFVVLADISGSMEKYARLMLQFCYSVVHGLQNVECFVFGTRLTRVTPNLRLKNIDRAVDEAAREVVDWSGGTRIGESLRTFNREWSRRVLGRGAVVLVVSDGWEIGDTEQLAQEVAYLQRRSYRLIWLNPLLGHAGYKPLVAGMAAALPHVDDFLPVHNLQSLETLSQHLASLGSRRSSTTPQTRSYQSR